MSAVRPRDADDLPPAIRRASTTAAGTPKRMVRRLQRRTDLSPPQGSAGGSWQAATSRHPVSHVSAPYETPLSPFRPDLWA
jgi:hypothetical protein